jgi:hypothetical protein
MSIEFVHIIAAASAVADMTWPEAVLAAAVPDLCPDCNGTGWVATRSYSDGIPMTEEACAHPSAPSIGKLLAIGAAVMTIHANHHGAIKDGSEWIGTAVEALDWLRAVES